MNFKTFLHSLIFASSAFAAEEKPLEKNPLNSSSTIEFQRTFSYPKPQTTPPKSAPIQYEAGDYGALVRANNKPSSDNSNQDDPSDTYEFIIVPGDYGAHKKVKVTRKQ